MKVIYNHLPHGGVGNQPDTIVVHCMAEYLLDPHPVDAIAFLDRIKLSAHAIVKPNGNVHVCRDDDETAWHARGHNQDSLGIEFLVPGEHDYVSFIERIKTPYVTPEAWDAGVECVRRWIDTYDIGTVIRHSTLSPGRKVDPGAGFNWDRFVEEIYA